MQKSYFIKTFGCQMNEHDSLKMESLLQMHAYQKSDTPEEAGLILVNTCSIRDKSHNKALSEIGRLGKNRTARAEAVIAVTGCVASQEGKALLSQFPFVDIVLGPDHIASLPHLAEESFQRHQKAILTNFKDSDDYEFPVWFPDSNQRASTAYVTIMKGCDNVCTFCIVPKVRGPEISRTSEEILREIRMLEERGVKEVILLGQNVNSYGKNLSGAVDFAGLLRRIDEETDLVRIRYISPHPKDFSEAVMWEHQNNPKLMPQIHLPVQSGSTEILRQMKRAHSRDSYLRKVQTIKAMVPDIAITTDLIVGFPGETEKDFEDTLSLVREVRFDSSYSFVFSPRPMTEAFAYEETVSREEKAERLERLQTVQDWISLEKNQACLGKKTEVLVEGPSKKSEKVRLSGSMTENIQLMGRNPQGKVVNFSGNADVVGKFVVVEIEQASAYSLKGKHVCQNESHGTHH